MSDYSIWMLEYAWVPDAPVSSLVYGKHNQGTTKLPYSYTLLKGHGRTILLDCGLNNAAHGAEFVNRFNVQNWYSPREVLAEVGCTPEQVDHVILTHAHFDHMGGLELFPNATFYIQQEELAAWVSIMTLGPKFRWLMTATDTGDMLYAVQLAREGRMRGLDGNTDDLFPGIDVRIARDTHTAGSQYVVIRNDGKTKSDDPFIYTGDLVYRHDNLHGGDQSNPMYVPIGLGFGSQTKLLHATHEMLEAVDFQVPRMLMGHEPAMTELYPSRITKNGHVLIEVALTPGQNSFVS